VMNVKVLLLPDGEDPDSFAKQKGASGYMEYIKENETDFIQFKTKLLMKTTENDPVARARLISDVIRSVAVIPDNITRSVYIKECSKLLSVGEDILYTEIRKQKHKQSDDFRKKEFREKARQKQAPPQPEKPEPKASEFLVEELEFLRFLLKHCNTPIFEEDGANPDETREMKVSEYMLDELENDDLVPDNKLFQKIFYEVKANTENSKFDPWKHFIYHEDAEVSKLATDLLSEKFIESKRWTKAGAYTEKEEEILDFLIPKIVYEYKFRRICIMLEGIEKDINLASEADDFNKVIECQSKYMNLKRVGKDLSDKLGNRAFN